MILYLSCVKDVWDLEFHCILLLFYSKIYDILKAFKTNLKILYLLCSIDYLTVYLVLDFNF